MPDTANEILKTLRDNDASPSDLLQQLVQYYREAELPMELSKLMAKPFLMPRTCALPCLQNSGKNLKADATASILIINCNQ